MRVLVTGCSSGIGRALAQELSRRGRRVVAGARDLSAISDLPVEKAVQLDVTSDRSVCAAVAAAGPVDVLINNAGVSCWGAVEAVPLRDGMRLFDTNLFGAVRMANAVLPGMRARRSGRILQISSAAALIAPPLLGYYAASKHALDALSQALRMEVAAFGIEVSIFNLGAIESKIGENRIQGDPDLEDYKEVGEHFRTILSGGRQGAVTSHAAAVMIADTLERPRLDLRYIYPDSTAEMLAEHRSMSERAREEIYLNGLPKPSARTSGPVD